MSATTHRAPKWRVNVGRWLTATLVAALAMTTLGVRMAYAWSTSQSATVVCSDGVKVNATFINTEPKDSGLDMVVTATVASKSGGTKTVKVGATEHFTIDLGTYTTSGGTVTFALKWANQAGADTRTATFGALNCVPANPGPRTVTTDWVDGAKSCATATVVQTRTVTTIPQVWGDSVGQYVDAPESEWTSTTESRNRDMTADEKAQCAGPQPPPDIVRGDWVDGAKSCPTGTVEQTRTVTSTPKVLNALGTAWVLDPAHAVTTTETQTRAMTDAEKAACPVATVKLCGSFVGYPAGSEWYAIAVYQGEEFLTFGWNPVADGISLELPSQGLYGVTLVVRGPDGTELSRTEYGPDNPLPSECVVYTFTPEKVAIPTQPASTDRCNPAGGAVVPPVWDATTDIDKYTWSVNDKGQKVVVLRDTVRTTWTDGTTAPKVFTLPADNGVVCQVPNKDLVPLIVTKTCGGVVKVANPAANPSVLVLWGDDLVNTENISGQLTVAPGATEQFTTSFTTVDLSFGSTVAGFEPYLQANLTTDQSACSTPTPTPTPTPSSTTPVDLCPTVDGKADPKVQTSLGDNLVKDVETGKCLTVSGDGANGGMDTVSQTITQPAWLAGIVGGVLAALVLAFAALRRRRSA